MMFWLEWFLNILIIAGNVENNLLQSFHNILRVHNRVSDNLDSYPAGLTSYAIPTPGILLQNLKLVFIYLPLFIFINRIQRGD